MAKYSVKHACGHIQVHQIFGTNSHGQKPSEQKKLKN